MKKTAIFFGSTMGTTETAAEQIASALGVTDVFNVSDTDASKVEEYEAVIFGSSTWGAGDLQDDWYDFLDALANCNLDGKSVAFFGLGDSSSYSDTFCDAVGTIYQGIQDKGCNFIGSVPTDGYCYDASTAEVNQGEFVGLLLDDTNESDLSEERINNWASDLKSSL